MITFQQFLTENKKAKLPAKVKSALGKYLGDLCKEYHKSIPLSDMNNEFKKHGVEFSEEFILTGREGRDNFPLKFNDEEIDNHLILSWYKMPSGNWEITAYIS